MFTLAFRHARAYLSFRGSKRKLCYRSNLLNHRVLTRDNPMLPLAIEGNRLGLMFSRSQSTCRNRTYLSVPPICAHAQRGRHLEYRHR
jgi:hypothetical protein